MACRNPADPVLQTGHLRDELRPFGHDAATRIGLFVRHPHFEYKSARTEIRKHRRVDLIVLRLCPSDGPHKDWIGDDDPSHERREQTDDRARVPVASMTISSSGFSLLANCNSRLRSRSIFPAFRICPLSRTAICANDRWTSRAMILIPGSFQVQRPMGAGGLTRQLRIRARSATGQVEGGGQTTTRALCSSDITACPLYVLPTPQSRWVDGNRSTGFMKRGLAYQAYTWQITI